MVKLRAFLALFLAVAVAGSATAASAPRQSRPAPVAKASVAAEHVPEYYGPTAWLVFVGQRLIVVHRTLRGIGIVDLPTDGNAYHIDGINDGSDGIDPLGAKERGGAIPAPASTRVPTP